MKYYKRVTPYIEFYSPAPEFKDYSSETAKAKDNFYYPYTLYEKEIIVRYLNAGDRYLSFTESLFDFVDNSYIGGHGMLTDNVWEWRSDVYFYFQKYNLKLDPDFILEVIMKNNQI
jgi:hypothetical protein